MVADKIWSEFLSILSSKDSPINPMTYNTWIKPLELYKLDQENNKIIIKVPMPVYKTILKTHWYEIIEKTFYDITNITYEISFILENEIIEENSNNLIVDNIEIIDTKPKFDTNLKKEFTFDTYVIGETNRFAKTTAMTVAQQPGIVYNPLFIYGKCGVGKTHLMQAIGNYIVENSNLNVLYTSSTVFRDDYVNITSGSKDDIVNKSKYFKNKYWDVDVLIIDDIQFLAGAERTQDEFFQIFEEFISKNKQLIISSDTSPKDLKRIEERLKSRLTYSLPVDIFPPDFDLKCRILKEKLKNFSIKDLITEDAIEYIANLYEGDIRPFIGAITRIEAFAAMDVPKVIDLKFVMDALGDDVTKNIYSNSSISVIQKAVADYYEITVDAMKGKKRSNAIAYPRMLAMYLARMLTEDSTTKIGLEFGGRDHSTVIHAIEKITEDLKDNKKLQEIVNEIKMNI
ncbi:MAG: chromosomal replication initiator protein DnaA [Bacilli bacterium]|nr:chromosomal replication initiator protein DnaA [Bacilli bacterium]